MLNVQGHAHIYALGDCAACMGENGKLVPPRAQAAHQQADYLLKTSVLQAKGKPAQGGRMPIAITVRWYRSAAPVRSAR